MVLDSNFNIRHKGSHISGKGQVYIPHYQQLLDSAHHLCDEFLHFEELHLFLLQKQTSFSDFIQILCLRNVSCPCDQIRHIY